MDDYHAMCKSGWQESVPNPGMVSCRRARSKSSRRPACSGRSVSGPSRCVVLVHVSGMLILYAIKSLAGVHGKQ